MKISTRRRVVVGLTAALLVGGFAIGTPEANAAIATYTCTGANNDVAGTQLFTNFTSKQLLTNLAGAIPNFPANPVLPITITPTTPAAVTPGNQVIGAFEFRADLPSTLVDAARGFGLSKVTVKNASFGVDVSGGTPASITGGFATKDVIFNEGTSVTHTVNGTVTPTVAPGGVVSFKAGVAKLSIRLNVDVGILLAHVDTVTLLCSPNDVTVAQTVIVNNTTTTTKPTTTTTTTTTTTLPEPTTTTTTTTTLPEPTTTTTTTTTTLPEPTTTTTTTTLPEPTTTTTTTAPPTTGTDTVAVRISGGLSYGNNGVVGGPGYKVRTDGTGIVSIFGRGTLPGKNGGTANVTVDAHRFLFWTMGDITVNDPGAGIRGVSAPLLFAPNPTGSKSAASVSAGWFLFTPNGTTPYRIDVTVGDN